MARNCAVIVGINDYDEISPLKYAKSDAERMRNFFMQDLGVSHDDLYFFTDDSPRNAQGRKTQPTYGTLKSFLGDRFANSFLSAGDTLWFYFSGHGMPCEGRDYLLPSDGNPRSIPDLAIPIGYVTERLRRSGADNVVMLIDACRSDGAKNAGMGIGEEKQQGVITFFSCSPSQVSYEIDEIGQGAFTNVLLEALRIQGEGNCATVERFANYLKSRVPQLTQRYKNYPQTPYVVIEPETKLHYILLPKFANLTDIALLREKALEAENEEDYDLAFQLWLRVNVSAGGTDIKAIKAFQRLANKQSLPNSQLKERVSDLGSKVPSLMRTFTTSTVGKKKVNAAFNRSDKTLEFIAVVSGTSRTAVYSFFHGYSIRKSIFIAICEALGLRWQEIAELEESEFIKEEVSDWGNKNPSASPIPEVKKNPVELLSAKGIDYRELEKLLKTKEWRKADELTARLMYQVAGREQEKEAWLREEDIKKFPCEDLLTIDLLWVHYSNGKFGFSVQKKLWRECGGEVGQQNYDIYKEFARRIGWYYPPKFSHGDGDWGTYFEFMDKTQNAQSSAKASLPSKVWEIYGLIGFGFGVPVDEVGLICWIWISLLSEKLADCSK